MQARTTCEDSLPISTPESSPFVCRIARAYEDRLSSFRLVYETYRHKGLIDANPYRLRVTPFHLLPTTHVFSAFAQDRIVCTMTLIGDGALGLPVDQVYPEEVQLRRSAGLNIGEVSCLAVRDLEPRTFLPLFIQLTRLMAQQARSGGMQQFLIATHPKHSRFYQRFMGFECIGPERSYTAVRNAPAVLCCLDFNRIDVERPACYDQYFKFPVPSAELLSRPMSPFEVELFRQPAYESGSQPVMMPVCA